MSRWIKFGLVVGTATAALAYHWLTSPTSEPQSLDTVKSALDPIAVPAATVVEPCASNVTSKIVPDATPEEPTAPSEAKESVELVSAPETSLAPVVDITVESNAAPVVATHLAQGTMPASVTVELYKDESAAIRNKVKMKRRKTPKKEVGSPVDPEGNVTKPELSQSDSELGSLVDPEASLDPPGESALVRKVRKRRRAPKKKAEVSLVEESVVDAEVSSNDQVPVVPVEPPIPAIVEVEDEAPGVAPVEVPPQDTDDEKLKVPDILPQEPPTEAVEVRSLSPSELFSAPAPIDSPMQQDNTTKKSENEDDVINTMTFWNSSQKNQQMTNWEEYFTLQKMTFLDKLSISKSSQNEPASDEKPLITPDPIHEDTKVKEEQATSEPEIIHVRSENPQVTDWKEYFTSLKKDFLDKSSVTKVAVAKEVPVEKDDEPDKMLVEVTISNDQGEREILMNDDAVVVPRKKTTKKREGHRLWKHPLWEKVWEKYSGEADPWIEQPSVVAKVVESIDNWADCDPLEE